MTDPAPLVGGRFAVARCLGSGTHSRVYLGWDVRRSQWLALRIPTCPTAASVERRARFREEMEAAGSVVHPYLARVVCEDHAGLPFAVLELAECGTVQDWLDRNGALPPRRAVAVARRCADALGHMHANGRVHGDLRPARLLVRSGGNVVVGWAGLAREATPFRAPEQGDATDLRVDLFGVGATLFTLLTGQAPVGLAGVEATDPRLAAVPGVLRPVVVMGCRRDPAERYASASELVAELDRLAGPLPIDPDRPPLDEVRIPVPHDGTVLEPDADLADLAASLALFAAVGRKGTTPPAAQRRSEPPPPASTLTLPPEPRAATPPPAPKRSTPPPPQRTRTPPPARRVEQPAPPGRSIPWGAILGLGIVLVVLVSGVLVCGTAVSAWSKIQASEQAAQRRAAKAEAELVAAVEAQRVIEALVAAGADRPALTAAWEAFRAAGPDTRGPAAAAFVEVVAAESTSRHPPPAVRAEVLTLQTLRRNWEATQGR